MLFRGHWYNCIGGNWETARNKKGFFPNTYSKNSGINSKFLQSSHRRFCIILKRIQKSQKPFDCQIGVETLEIESTVISITLRNVSCRHENHSVAICVESPNSSH